ncbi:MAG: hypothetical protein V3V14_14500 [Saprospiraceae bacterium]
MINKNKRLGLHGLPNVADRSNSFRSIDVSTIQDNIYFYGSITNHLYYYSSPTVMADLKKIIWEKKFNENKKFIGINRKMVLLS